MSYTLMILGMVAVTYAVKATFFVFGERIRFPEIVTEALGYVPVAVLTAIVVPMMLAPEGAIAIRHDNPQLVAGLAAIAVAAVFRRQILTVVVALALFLALRLVVLA